MAPARQNSPGADKSVIVRLAPGVLPLCGDVFHPVVSAESASFLRESP